MTPFQQTFEPVRAALASSAPDNSSTPPGLSEAVARISHEHGIQAAYNALMRAEVIQGLRKPTLAIYDHTFHLIGGGQKYGFTMAYALKEMFDITLIASREITHQNLMDWYQLDLSQCQIKIIPLPFFDQFQTVHLDPARVTIRTQNPFHAVSRESGNYDFFINNSMNEKILPLSNVSSLICHFPERRPRDYFYADRYSHVIFNSNYTAHWVQNKWGFKPHKHIYPPVDMAPETHSGNESQKENIILSVARFEEGGSKKQLEMVRTFAKLNRRFPELFSSWRLVLAGGSGNPDENPYLNTMKELIRKSGSDNIQLKINCPGSQLKELYARASIFWHLCGLDQTDPALVEHFGMTIVEAMQNKIVPIVFDGGGQREIVEQEVSGFRVSSTAQLMTTVLKLVRDNKLRQEMAVNAAKRSKLFSRETFEQQVREFYRVQLENYNTI